MASIPKVPGKHGGNFCRPRLCQATVRGEKSSVIKKHVVTALKKRVIREKVLIRIDLLPVVLKKKKGRSLKRNISTKQLNMGK